MWNICNAVYSVYAVYIVSLYVECPPPPLSGTGHFLVTGFPPRDSVDIVCVVYVDVQYTSPPDFGTRFCGCIPNPLYGDGVHFLPPRIGVWMLVENSRPVWVSGFGCCLGVVWSDTDCNMDVLRAAVRASVIGGNGYGYPPARIGLVGYGRESFAGGGVLHFCFGFLTAKLGVFA